MSHVIQTISVCLLTAAAAATTPAATAQSPQGCAVAGVVRGKDGRPLTEVAVVTSHGLATATNQHGWYCVPAETPGLATMSFRASGFTQVESSP